MTDKNKKKALYQLLPNFLVVGAAKAGTTSLFNYLKQHPDVYLPPLKETRFFISDKLKTVEFYNQNTIYSLEKYRKLFLAKHPYRAVGEFCNSYLLFDSESIKNIKKYLGKDVKIIIILRNPIDRAFSAYQFACRNLYEPYSFSEALEKEYERIKSRKLPPDIFWYKSYGLYYKKVKNYMENFDHVEIWLFEDLFYHTRDTLSEIFEFIEVNPNAHINIQKAYNKGGWVPTNKALVNKFFAQKRIANIFKSLLRPIPLLYKVGKRFYQFLEKFRYKLIKKKKVELPPVIKKELSQYFENDIKQLEKLINRDLSRWLK